MKDQARVVIIGGGITRRCVLYHLAKAGCDANPAVCWFDGVP